MKTIFHVIETIGPGGAETVFIQLATRDSDDQFRNIAALPGRGWVGDTLIAEGLTPLDLPISRDRPAVDFALYRNLVRLIRENKVDLLHSHAFGISVYACLAGLRTGIPVVCTLHGELDLGLTRRWRRIKIAILRRGASKIVLVSNHMRDRLLAESKIPVEQTAVVYNGVDCELHAGAPNHAFRAELGISSDCFLFGAVGNVRILKSYDNLLRAAAIAVKANPKLRVAVVGEASGPLYEGLLQLRAELGLQDIVYFAGFRTDITRPLQSFDGFVLSSKSEGFSIATVQAMASGLPVIATRSGGPEEIITDGVDGLLVPRADPDALAAAMLGLAGDGNLRAKLGKAARASARAKFSLATMLESYEEIYDAALTRKVRK
jgi:glycosyltransferase involved in cell wall biosynthesis